MKKNEEKMHFPKVTLDNYFSSQEERDAEKQKNDQIDTNDSGKEFTFDITVTGTKPTSEKVTQSCADMYIQVTSVTFGTVTYWE